MFSSHSLNPKTLASNVKPYCFLVLITQIVWAFNATMAASEFEEVLVAVVAEGSVKHALKRKLNKGDFIA